MLMRTLLACMLVFSAGSLWAQSLPLISPGYFDSLGLDVLSTGILLPIGIAGDAPVPGIDIAVGSINQVFGNGGPIDGLAVSAQSLTTGAGPFDQGLDVIYSLLGGEGVFTLLLNQSPLPLPLFDQAVLATVGLDQTLSVDALASPLSSLPGLSLP